MDSSIARATGIEMKCADAAANASPCSPPARLGPDPCAEPMLDQLAPVFSRGRHAQRELRVLHQPASCLVFVPRPDAATLKKLIGES